MMTGKYRLSTLGCKVNQYESEQVRELLESMGLRPAGDGERADIAIVNTCAVTCSATAKSRQTIRKLSEHGATQTIAIGCYASAEPDRIAAIDGVGDVIGHDGDPLAEVRKAVAKRLAGLAQAIPGLARDPSSATGQVGVRPGVEGGRSRHPDKPTTSYSISARLPVVNGGDGVDAPIREFSGHTRAFLKIQDGCDAQCTYCIIPNLRSRLRSKPVDEAVAEARQLVAAGHREIVLTGIFLGAYGRPTALRRRFGAGSTPLVGLVDALARVEGLSRLRLSSLEPGDVDNALLDVVAAHHNCVPHFHLPLQAGSGEILRRMNRQYTIDDFIAMIDRVNRRIDRPAISTDIIVGFPGETDAMFSETLSVARYSRFCKIHAFPFSPRPGTAAARWSRRFVHNSTVKERMTALRRMERRLAIAYQSQFVGATTRVLVENAAPQGDDNGNRNDKWLAHGRSDRYFEVYFETNGANSGDLLNIRIDRITPTRTHGHVVAQSGCQNASAAQHRG